MPIRVLEQFADPSAGGPAGRAAALVAALFVVLLAVFAPFAALAQTVVVGGKNFTEQLLMAEMTSQLLRSKGFEVETRLGYDTTSLRRALEAGRVDLYWEYTGTSIRDFHRVTERLSPADTYARVKQLDGERGLVWLEPSRVDNSYALAMRRADALEKGVATISELAEKVRSGERFIFASNSEFYERSDGLRPLEQAYGFQFGADRVVRLDTDLIYQVLRDLKLVDVGLVFATDGRIPAYDLLVLKDDKGFFPNYAMAPVVRREFLDRHPALAGHLQRLSALLDNDIMARLNRMIDVDKVRIGQVASDFLRKNGLL